MKRVDRPHELATLLRFLQRDVIKHRLIVHLPEQQGRVRAEPGDERLQLVELAREPPRWPAPDVQAGTMDAVEVTSRLDIAIDEDAVETHVMQGTKTISARVRNLVSGVIEAVGEKRLAVDHECAVVANGHPGRDIAQAVRGADPRWWPGARPHPAEAPEHTAGEAAQCHAFAFVRARSRRRRFAAAGLNPGWRRTAFRNWRTAFEWCPRSS